MKDPSWLQCLVVVAVFLFAGIAKAADTLGADLTGRYAWALFWFVLIGCAPVWFGAVTAGRRVPKPPEAKP
jgi:hypothetical protein